MNRPFLPILRTALFGGLAVAAMFSSCTRETDCILTVKVVQYEFDQINQDTVLSPVANADVRIYQDERLGTDWLDETKQTGSAGTAEFTLKNPAIIKVDVYHAGRESLENFIILEAGETKQLEVNLDEE